MMSFLGLCGVTSSWKIQFELKIEQEDRWRWNGGHLCSKDELPHFENEVFMTAKRGEVSALFGF